MNAPVVHFLPLTQIRRERVLPIAGKVLVRKGQKLSAMTIVAETVLNPEYQLLDISRILGISRSKTDQHIHCRIGDRLSKGDKIAGPVGVSQRLVRAQSDGEVILAGDGQVLIELISIPHQISAGIPGEVIDLIPDRGAVIQTTGALIQAIWGNEQLNDGMLIVLAKTPSTELVASDLDDSMRGAIVFTGHCGSLEALKTADQIRLGGLILGSMHADLIQTAGEVRFPILLLEGFGRIPVNSLAFRLLSAHDHRNIAINACSLNHFSNRRPEIVIPLPAPSSVSAPKEVDEFSASKQVRILRSPWNGTIGTIVKLSGNTLVESGLRVKTALVRISEERTVEVPLANLELVI